MPANIIRESNLVDDLLKSNEETRVEIYPLDQLQAGLKRTQDQGTNVVRLALVDDAIRLVYRRLRKSRPSPDFSDLQLVALGMRNVGDEQASCVRNLLGWVTDSAWDSLHKNESSRYVMASDLQCLALAHNLAYLTAAAGKSNVTVAVMQPNGQTWKLLVEHATTAGLAVQQGLTFETLSPQDRKSLPDASDLPKKAGPTAGSGGILLDTNVVITGGTGAISTADTMARNEKGRVYLGVGVLCELAKTQLVHPSEDRNRPGEYRERPECKELITSLLTACRKKKLEVKDASHSGGYVDYTWEIPKDQDGNALLGAADAVILAYASLSDRGRGEVRALRLMTGDGPFLKALANLDHPRVDSQHRDLFRDVLAE